MGHPVDTRILNPSAGSARPLRKSVYTLRTRPQEGVPLGSKNRLMHAAGLIPYSLLCSVVYSAVVIVKKVGKSYIGNSYRELR